ncbi:uncharacterized protein [Mytilus edulis]|uniref:uncharacterized protein n=1 Tax=Mytilus edulis TaxID=6550 RepID=UPI0039F02188
MPQYCSVPGCRNSGGHKFPEERELQLRWRVAIKRRDSTTKGLWKPGKHDVVCAAHFKEADYRVSGLLGSRKRLLPDAVPSLFLFRESSSPRSSKYSRRDDVDLSVVNNVQFEVAVDNEAEVKEKFDDLDGIEPMQQEMGVHCTLLGRFSIENLENDPKRVQCYTSFRDYEHFMLFFNCLGPAVTELNYQCLSLTPKDQLFMCLMKLRQNKEDLELSFLFEVSESTVSKIVITWINFMYFQLKEINIWPSRDIVTDYMPDDFKYKFATTRVILDATETPIQKPSHVDAQSVTWSSYKHKNTIKTMIGCTPRGTVSYVSDAYGGSANDRQIIEKSELLQLNLNLFEQKDSIMADRGIMVQDLFAAQDVKVNTPTMLKGKSQLEPEEVVRDRRVASKRIHIERVIGLAKTFKILKNELPSGKLILGSRIIFVCFSIANFRKCIVNENA